MRRIYSKDIRKATDVNIVEEEDSWNSYVLDDGTTLKVRVIVEQVKRLDKHKRDGTPIYVVKLAYVTRLTNVPKHLKGKPKISAYHVVS